MEEKSNLQAHAERVAEQFVKKARKPLIIEFAGVPKAGKTSTLTQVNRFLKRCGFQTDVVVERASICPIRDKKHHNFNVWTACTTLAQILEKTQNPPRSEDPQILFLDRGIFDSICWMTMMEQLSRIRPYERDVIQKFLTLDDWKKRISAVFVMLASPQDALKREEVVLPVVGPHGSIMNLGVLKQIKEINEQCIEQLKEDFQIYPINTSYGETKNNQKRTAEVVTDVILTLIEKQVSENILSCSKETVKNLFGDSKFIYGSQANELAKQLREDSDSYFRPRDEVEEDNTRVQAIPIVIVRNKSGEVLRLRRREITEDNPLHNRIVIWAGGHVRSEDDTNGDRLIHCAIRELEEELRLQVEFSSLHLIGAVYIDSGGRTSRHVAIAYEWRAPTDDVSVVLSRSEFYERSGTSLSGHFISVDELARDVENNNRVEPWSMELIREYLAKGTYEFNPTLF